MVKEAVFHINTEEYVYPVNRQTLVFRIRCGKDDVRECRLVHWDRTRPDEKTVAVLDSIITDELFEYWECSVTYDSVAKYRKYYFELTDTAGSTVYVTANGITVDPPRDGYFEYLYANGTDVIEVPDWAKGAIYYQIFPERFANGDPTINPSNTQPWGTLPTRENYMGGDLQGIIDHIDYLGELGIDCIYLNPIFEADFNHKYATTDYYRIDPQFGTNEKFKELVDECHKNNIRIILDGVFNHTGVHFKPFEDIIQKQVTSKYVDWFHIKKYPVEYSEQCYECVGDYKWMPKLNTANPEVRSYIVDVMKYWIEEFDIDGWRLDVSDEVDPSVWEEARLILKNDHPEIILIGETWGYGGRLLRGNQMDSVMNYMFRDAVWDYYGRSKITATEFANRISHMLSLYKTCTNQIMFNLIDSHDTERFMYIAGESKDRFRLAVTFQMMFVGAPSIYYGDEIGMTGDNDPDDRRCMDWDMKDSKELLDYYKELTKFRKNHPAIRCGQFKFVEADSDKDLIVFKRSNEDETVYVILHNGTGVVETKVEDENISMSENTVKIICK